MGKKCVKQWISLIISLLLVVPLLCSVPMLTYAATDVTVIWNDEKQEIDGFGASQAADCYAADLYNFPEPQRSEIMDLLFSPTEGIGLSILRCEVGCGQNLPTIEPQEGVWNFDGDPAELWVINGAKERGVDKIISTVWSPPAWMKTNNSVFNGGYLKQECYPKYAEYLAKYIKGYKQHHNIDIYGISITNEPEYAASWQSCLWSSDMLRNFIANYLKPTFETENVNTKVIVGETGMWSESRVVDSLNDPVACSRIDIVAGHNYSGIIGPFTTAQAKGKKVWETEVSDTQEPFDSSMTDGLYWAKKIHKFMKKAEANAFLYWLGACYKNCNESLIRLDQTTNSYQTSKRLYTFGNYSRFIKPGYIRIGTTGSSIIDVYVSAYKDPITGDFSIVVINDSNSNNVLNIVPQGFTSGKVTPYLTNEQVSLQQCADIPFNNGEFTASVGAKSVTTFVGKNGSAPMPTVNWTVKDNLDDWSKVYNVSGGSWMLETENLWGRYDEDACSARRTTLADSSIIYKYDNISDFSALVYFYENLQGISFYTSTDNHTWNVLEVNHTPIVATAAGWNKTTFSSANIIPSGTKYLRVEFSGGNEAWNKHLAQMNILCDTPTSNATDTLDNWTKVYERSANWILDGDKIENFEGDISRARRTTATTEYVVYAAGEGKAITDFEAKIYYFNNLSYDLRGAVSFYTSTDNNIWQSLEVTSTRSLETLNHWNRLYYSPTGAIPNGTKYLKIEFSGGGLYPWDKQLSEIKLVE